MKIIPIGNDSGKLWKLIEKERCLSKEQFKEISKRARQDNQYLTEALFESDKVPHEKLVQALSALFELPSVRLRGKTISPLTLNLIPKEVAQQHAVVAFKKNGEVLDVATSLPENDQTIDFIRQQTGCEVRLFITAPADIDYALRRYKSDLSEEFAQILKSSTDEALAVQGSEEQMARFVPIIKMVNGLLEQAVKQGASDIHFQPEAQEVVVRFRVDGLLQKVVTLPRDILSAIVARLKLMSNLKIDEHRQAQDGRFHYKIGERGLDVRVSAIPTLHGTKMVLRLLDESKKRLSLRRLGLNSQHLDILKKEIKKPYGMILVTGPTGSGKTTTLYTLLRTLNSPEVNICTVEDPIEFGLEGVNQTQVSKSGGITFATGLKSLLRQDPNILMVGEIRDAETANIAMNAAMTGHLVLSTLHTNNVFLVPQRLIEMGVEPYLAASVINLIIGQRLVRQICDHCRSLGNWQSKKFDKFRSSFDLPKAFKKFQRLGFLAPTLTFDDLRFAYGHGCSKCQRTGYRGRLGIFEILPTSDHLSQMILQRQSADDLRQEALQKDFMTMEEDGLLKVFQGRTTFEEVLRVRQE